MAYELTIVVPTLNERGNIEKLVGLLEKSLEGVTWEAVFVDDNSADGTADLVEEIARSKPYIRGIRRIGRHGLASAAIEGMLSSYAPYLALMDADLQHDEKLLGPMLETLRAGEVEIISASRFMSESVRQNFSPPRELLSRLGNRLANAVSGANLSDPLSGFFMLRKELLMEIAERLSGQGYKILLDIVMSAGRPVSIVELPMAFRERHSGGSKLDGFVAFAFLLALVDKAIGWFFPSNLIKFAIFVIVGVAVQLAILAAVYQVLNVPFLWAQTVAILAFIAGTFVLARSIGRRGQRVRNGSFLNGLLTLCLSCTIGAAGNLLFAQYLYDNGIAWGVAGALGAIVSTVWTHAALPVVVRA